MRKKLVLKIGDKYYFSEVGGFFKLKIYGISEANLVTDKLQKIIDFEIVENKAYPIKDHLLFYFSVLKDKLK